MKKLLIHIVFIFVSITGYSQVQIPDAAFLNFLKGYDSQLINASDELIISKAALVTSNLSCNNCGITNLEGIQYFTQVTKINFSGNQIVSIPSLLPMTKLETVHLTGNKLTSVPSFVDIQNLKTVLLYENELTAMPLFGNNPIIEEIIISKNKITDTTSLSGVTSLLKLDVGENQLTQLPNLSANVNLEELICWSNQLTALPSLTNLTKLTRLNASKNKLKETPDFTTNTKISILALNGNLLTVGPAIAGFTNLSDVQLYNNYFTFEDLLPYTSIANFSSVFDCTPMLRVPIADTINSYYNEPVIIHSNIDNALSGVTYDWYEGTTKIGGPTDELNITQLSAAGVSRRYMYVKIKHASISDLTLTTDSIVVQFNPCPVSSDISYKAVKTDCGNSGSVDVEVQGYVAPQTSYMLTSSSFGTNTYYTSNKINGLSDTAYSLQITFTPTCVVNYNASIKMPVVDCDESFMTPNNDGDMDTYLFAGKGTVIIYDKYGKEVKRASLPYEWDGSGQQGLVQPGYYIGVINGGKERINISVLY